MIVWRIPSTSWQHKILFCVATIYIQSALWDRQDGENGIEIDFEIAYDVVYVHTAPIDFTPVTRI